MRVTIKRYTYDSAPSVSSCVLSGSYSIPVLLCKSVFSVSARKASAEHMLTGQWYRIPASPCLPVPFS